MAVVTMKQLLEAGVHFGHQTRRWNPKMKRFIFGERNGIHVIDLDQTLSQIEQAYAFVRDLVAGGGTIMFVGTKRQAQDAVQSYAEKCSMPYVNNRWLGGMLTNYQTIAKRVAKMQDYLRMQASGEFDAMPKKEALQLTRELTKLQRNLWGIRNLESQPDAIFVLDTKKEHIAVTEAQKLGLPIVAVVDTNCDPDEADYVIPGNDDAIRSGTLMCRVIADAVAEGHFIRNRRAEMPARTEADEEEVSRQQAEARRQAIAEAKAREARLSGSPARPQTAPDIDPVRPQAKTEAVETPATSPAEPASAAAPAEPTPAPAAEETTPADPGAKTAAPGSDPAEVPTQPEPPTDAAERGAAGEPSEPGA